MLYFEDNVYEYILQERTNIIEQIIYCYLKYINELSPLLNIEAINSSKLHNCINIIVTVEQYILPGSHIMHDGWASYANIANISGGVYTHSTIIHQCSVVMINEYLSTYTKIVLLTSIMINN